MTADVYVHNPHPAHPDVCFCDDCWSLVEDSAVAS